MAKFEVLKHNRVLLKILGIDKRKSGGFFTSIQTYYVLFCAIFLNITACGTFVAKNFSHDFGLSLEALSLVIVGYQYGGMFLSVGLEMKLINHLHLELQKIVDKSEQIQLSLHQTIILIKN